MVTVTVTSRILGTEYSLLLHKNSVVDSNPQRRLKIWVTPTLDKEPKKGSPKLGKAFL